MLKLRNLLLVLGQMLTPVERIAQVLCRKGGDRGRKEISKGEAVKKEEELPQIFVSSLSRHPISKR